MSDSVKVGKSRSREVSGAVRSKYTVQKLKAIEEFEFRYFVIASEQLDTTFL
jgi:hypothetical protein